MSVTKTPITKPCLASDQKNKKKIKKVKKGIPELIPKKERKKLLNSYTLLRSLLGHERKQKSTDPLLLYILTVLSTVAVLRYLIFYSFCIPG